MPPIGKLRHRIALQSASEVEDSYGQPTRTWTTYATVWAQVEPVNGDESYQADQQQGSRTHTITIRYRAGVTANHRAIFNNRELNFTGPPVDPEERGIWLVISAYENTSP